MLKIGVHGVMDIATAQLHLRKSELRFFSGLNPPGSLSEIWDGESYNTYRNNKLPDRNST